MVLGRKHIQACVYFHEAAAPEETSLIRFFGCDCVIRSLLMSLHHLMLPAVSLGPSGSLHLRKQREVSGWEAHIYYACGHT